MVDATAIIRTLRVPVTIKTFFRFLVTALNKVSKKPSHLLMLADSKYFFGLENKVRQAGIITMAIINAASTPTAVRTPNSCNAGIPVNQRLAKPIEVVMLVRRVAKPVSVVISLIDSFLDNPFFNSSK